MLTTIERRQKIVLMTEEKGKVSVKDLAKTFDISEVSIRHDLNELGKRGLVIRSRGGAVACDKIAKELSVKDKHNENYEIKVQLAKAVANLIEDGDSLIIDSGTTTEEVAKALTGKKELTVMTNGLNIGHVLADIEDADVFMLGGKLRKKSQSFYSSEAEQTLSKYNFKKVILGVDGIDTDAGITTHYEPEAMLNRSMCTRADQVIVVTDSTKFGKRALYNVLPLKSIDVLVTDKKMPNEFVESLIGLGIEVITV
ncbi:transcriptional repressor AgaR [Pseudoalteromonas sp. GB56]